MSKLKAKKQDQLMTISDEVFWEELDALEGRSERYLVVDSTNHEVVVENARLLKGKKIRV